MPTQPEADSVSSHLSVALTVATAVPPSDETVKLNWKVVEAELFYGGPFGVGKMHFRQSSDHSTHHHRRL